MVTPLLVGWVLGLQHLLIALSRQRTNSTAGLAHSKASPLTEEGVSQERTCAPDVDDCFDADQVIINDD